MTTTQDTAISLADNVIGASQGGDGLGPTSLSGRIALLTRFAELVAAHAEKWAMLGAEFKGLPPHWALQQWWVDGWDLLLTPTLAEPPPLLTEFEKTPSTRRHPAAGRAVRRVHAAVQHERAAGDQPAGAPQRRGPPHRDPARRLWAGRHPDPCRLPTAIGTPLVARPPGDPLTLAVRDIESFVRHPTLGQPHLYAATQQQPSDRQKPITRTPAI